MTRYEHFLAAALNGLCAKGPNLELPPLAKLLADEMEIICRERDDEEIKRSNEQFKKWAESEAGKKELAAIEKNMGANYVGTIASVSNTNRGNV